LLPVGLVGLMIAALIAAVMSTCDAFMVHSSALFTKNVYLSFINPGASDSKQLKVGRITSIITVIGGIVFALVIPSVIDGIIEVWKVTAYLGVAFWVGVIWKKANRYGAWVSTIVMAILSIYMGNILNLNIAVQIAVYIPTGFILMILVSRYTPGEPKEKLRQFFLLLNTPVGKEQRLKDANVNIKLEGISQGKLTKERNKSGLEKYIGVSKEEDGLLIVDLLSLKKKFTWGRYKTDIIGFLAAAFLAGMMIYSAIILAGIGA
jgi:Na+/proline symporter